MKIRIIEIFVLFIISNSLYASACESLWVGNTNEKGSIIIKQMYKIAESERRIIVLTPKALRYARKQKNLASALRGMHNLVIRNWKFIVLNECDIQLINKLEISNRKTLKKVSWGIEDKFTINFSGAKISTVITVLSKMCKLPLELSKSIKNPLRVWVASATSMSCTDLPMLFSAHGIKIILDQGKLIAEKA